MSSSIIRIAGIVEPGPRGPLLRAAEGTVWRVSADETTELLIGQPIMVEGVRNGSAIAAYYCGPAPDPAQC